MPNNYTGKVNASLVSRPLDERLYLSTNMQVADENTYDPEVFSVPSGEAGSLHIASPIRIHNLYNAFINETPNTVFYQGVYFQQEAVIVNQTSFNIGFISADFQTFFELFSTASQKRTVQSLSILPATAGLTIAGLSVSDVFYPYEEKSVGIDVDLSGDASINATFSIKFTEDPVTYTMAITGARVGAFFLSDPNWAEGITVERRFLTSVFASQNMSEHRKVLRSRPVRTLKAGVFFHGKHGAGRAWSALRDASKQTTAHPWYPDRSVQSASSGASRVYCPTEYRRFQPDGYAFVVNTATNDIYADFEVIQIDEVFADGFSTKRPLVNSYGLSDIAYPAVVCYAALEGNPAELMTDRIGLVSITAEEAYASSGLDNENSGYTPTIRNSLPVFDLETTFSEVPEISVIMGGGAVSSGRGTLVTTRGVPYVIQSATAICRTKEECWEALGFFNYLKGRGKPFWTKSELDFLNVVGSSGNTSVTVDNPNVLADWAYLKYLWVQDSTGAFDIIEVVDAQASGDNWQFTLASNSLADISKIWQAHAVRLEEDLVTEEYLTDGVMLSTFTVQELQGI